MDAISSAKALFAEIIQEIDSGKLVSEEDTKVHLINRILFEVFGWPHSSIRYEKSVDEGYIDIVVDDTDRCYAVLEAKRIGQLNLNTANSRKSTYKITGPVLKDCLSQIEQCAKYFQSSGAQVGCVTDGMTWIFFRTYLDGRPYKDGHAIVFPYLTSITEDFGSFYDLLSRPAVKLSHFKSLFDEANSGISYALLSTDTVAKENEYFVLKKDPIAYDIDQILKRYFSTLSGDDDPELIVDCFVETKESRIADFSLEKITRSIIGNIAPADTDVPNELSVVIEDALQYQRGETIFIIGPSGAGKSTFVTRFFRRVLPSTLRDRCLLLTLNAVDAKGDPQSFMPWMTERLIAQIERAHFAKATPTYDELRGLYHSEYLKRSIGVDAPLYASDKDAFKRKFSDILDGLVTNDRNGYLERLLNDTISNRKKLPIFVVDNCDEFPNEFREMVYQYFQSIRRHCGYALLIFPMTDQTAWSFMRSKLYNIYPSKSFFLPTPSPKEVIRKRIDYLRRRATENSGNRTPSEYFSSQASRLQSKTSRDSPE